MALLMSVLGTQVQKGLARAIRCQDKCCPVFSAEEQGADERMSAGGALGLSQARLHALPAVLRAIGGEQAVHVAGREEFAAIMKLMIAHMPNKMQPQWCGRTALPGHPG